MQKYGGRRQFHLWEYPRSGSKAKDVKEKEKERDPKLVITMASYTLQTPPRVAHASRLGQKKTKFTGTN